jgi:hypothetical protein
MPAKQTALEYAEALEAIAAIYRENPDMPIGSDVYVWCADRESFLRGVRALAKGGTVKKYADPSTELYPDYHADRDFGKIRFQMRVARSLICRLVTPAIPAKFECPDSLLEEAGDFPEVSNEL